MTPLPCPFCGGDNLYVPTPADIDDRESPRTSVECLTPHCGASGPDLYGTRGKTAAEMCELIVFAWNHRPTPAAE